MASSNQSDVKDASPYPSQYQLLGETPSIIPDIPINAVFLFLFILGAIGHAWQYRINILCGRKFIPNAAAFAFCITRIFTTILWIVWACNPSNIDCETASLIFGYVGIILLFIINLIFSRRIVRGQHPNFGWTMLFSVPFTIISLIVVATIICLIVAIVLMFCTRDRGILRSALEIQRYGATLYAIVAVLPILIVGVSSLARRHPRIAAKPVDKFGEGSMCTKVVIVIVTALLLAAGACYRAGTILAPLVPVSQPPAPWLSKAVFYVFTFSIEWAVVVFWLAMRIDRRFYVPDGAWGPHSYAGGFVFAGEPGNEKGPVGGGGGTGSEDGAADSNSSRRSLVRSVSTEHYKRWFLGGGGGASSTNISTNNSTSNTMIPSSNTNNSSNNQNNKSPRPSSDTSRPSRPTVRTTTTSTIGPSPAPPPRALSRVSRISRISTTLSTTTEDDSQNPTQQKRRRRTSSLASTSTTRRFQRSRTAAAREASMTWGGVSREEVCDTLGESRQIIPYPGFELAEVEDLGAADVGGAVKEMGFDPRSGKWALRRIESARESSGASLKSPSLKSPSLKSPNLGSLIPSAKEGRGCKGGSGAPVSPISRTGS